MATKQLKSQCRHVSVITLRDSIPKISMSIVIYDLNLADHESIRPRRVSAICTVICRTVNCRMSYGRSQHTGIDSISSILYDFLAILTVPSTMANNVRQGRSLQLDQ